MTQFTIVRDASLALRNYLFDYLASTPDVDFGLGDVTTDIVLSAPNSTISDQARLSVYLYHIEPEASLRNQPKLAVGPGALVRAPLALCHRYLITPLLDEEDRNQLMIGRILQALHDQPFVSQTDAGSVGDSMGGGSPELRLTLESLTLDELSRVWYALGSDYRLSIAYLMRVVLIDSAIAPIQAPRVAEQHLAVQRKG